MRHRKGFNHLGRSSAHRKAMLANMASSLIMHKRITTTTAKAKALRTYVEPLITKSKSDSTHSRRVVFSYLKDKHAVSELFREVSPKIMDRPGGYTRILKTGNRLGDNAEMCIIELVDYNANLLEATETKTKSTRRRRGKKKTAEQKEIVADTTEMKDEDTSAKETSSAPEKATPSEPAQEIVAEEKKEVSEKMVSPKEAEKAEPKAKNTEPETKPEDKKVKAETSKDKVASKKIEATAEESKEEGETEKESNTKSEEKSK